MTTQKNAPMFSNDNPFMKDNVMNAYKNPFELKSLFASKLDDVPADAPEGSYTYRLVQNGPAVPNEECEAQASAVEIVVRWGASVLHVAHVSPPRAFYVGDEVKKGETNDFVLPADKLGMSRMPLVVVREGVVKVVVPAHASGTMALEGASSQSLRDLCATAPASAEVAGAVEIALPAGAKAELEIGGIGFSIASVKAGRKVAGRVKLDSRGLPFTALSFALHAGLLAATAFFMPPLAMAEEGTITEEQKHTLMVAFQTLAEREPEQKNEPAQNDPSQSPTGGTGAAAVGESGKMGSEVSTNKSGRFAVKSTLSDADPQLARSRAIADARDFGMNALLTSGMAGDPNAPIAAWGGVMANGDDARSANGNMWGASIDDATGGGGLGLTGIGENGGGRFNAIGLGNVGTIGHASGNGDGIDFGNGNSHGRLRPTHQTKSPGTMRIGTPNVSGRLPPDAIQRVVRANFGRYRLCYENGLRNNPNLQGRVAVRFIIDRNGAVSSAQNGGSDLPDASVVSCVTRAFYGLSFPQPENGIVTVTYPLVFTPAN